MLLPLFLVFALLQYVVETRFVGEREHGVAGAEIVDVKDRVVEVAEPGPTCPVNTGVTYHSLPKGCVASLLVVAVCMRL